MTKLEKLERKEQQLIKNIENSMNKVIISLERNELEKASYNFNEFENNNFDLLELWSDYEDLNGFAYAYLYTLDYNFALGEGQHTRNNFLKYICEKYDLDSYEFECLCEEQENYNY